MLTKTHVKIASQIAGYLMKDGMIWGDELEWYIKINTKGLLSFKNDEHYLAFEDLVLDRIERNKKSVVVNDIETREEFRFDNISRCAEYFGCTYDRVRVTISNRGIMYKRYKIRYETKTIKDLSKIN